MQLGREWRRVRRGGDGVWLIFKRTGCVFVPSPSFKFSEFHLIRDIGTIVRPATLGSRSNCLGLRFNCLLHDRIRCRRFVWIRAFLHVIAPLQPPLRALPLPRSFAFRFRPLPPLPPPNAPTTCRFFKSMFTGMFPCYRKRNWDGA